MSQNGIRPGDDQQSNRTLLVYNPHALASLQHGLRQVSRTRGDTKDSPDILFSQLTVNLRILDYLYRQAVDVLRGDLAAGVAFHRALHSLTERYPDFHGSTSVLFSRVGIPIPTRGALASSRHVDARARARVPSPATNRAMPAVPVSRRGLPCATIRYPGMAAIYMALWQVHILRRDDLPQPPAHELAHALDMVVGLSLGHGHLEVLSGSLARGGVDALRGVLAREDTLGHPFFRPDYGFAGSHLPIPEPDGSKGFPVPGSGRAADFGGVPIPGHIYPPVPDECEVVRQACEAWLIEGVNAGLPPLPLPPRVRAWADTIERIELMGRCAGDTMVIHGRDFGEPKPPTVDVVMNVHGACALVPVDPANWSDTRITVTLPDGVMPGTVGFYDRAQAENERDRYNGSIGRYNGVVRSVVTASRCLGRPLDLPSFAPILDDSIPCPPETQVNMIEVGQPIIYSFTVASDTASGQEIAAAPEDELMLRWHVENADTVEVRRIVVGDPPHGPQFDGSNAVTNPEGSCWNLGLAGHWAFAVFTYQLTARNTCGVVQARVRVVASQHPRIHIEQIEVTQGIQTVTHDLPLVRYKPTVVRVYATHGLNGFGGQERVSNVAGRMRVRSGAAWSLWFSPINGAPANPPDPPLPSPDASIDLPEHPDPTRVNDTLNFVVPEALCRDTMDIEVELRVDNFGAPPGSLGFSECVRRVFEDAATFQRRRLNIRYIPVQVNLNQDNGDISVLPEIDNPPTDDQCRDFLLEAFKLLPATPASIERLHEDHVTIEGGRVVIRTNAGTFPIDLGSLPISSESAPYDVHANVILEWYGVLRGCDFVDVSGGVCPDNDDEYWVLLAPVTGVWGRAHWAARVCITPMNLISAAHEIAHTLNQHHITPAGCSDGGRAYGSHPTSNPDTWEDGGAIVPEKAVPFDIIRNRTVTNSDDGVWDLMTYCGTRWTHPQRWRMLFGEIGG